MDPDSDLSNTPDGGGDDKPDSRDQHVEGDDAAADVSAKDRSRLIVGIGASAGGIEALKAFFSGMPVDIGMAFVVVQHLDPTFESALASIIAGCTKMPVQVAVDGAVVQSNQIYVIPPNSILTIEGGTLRVAHPALPADRRVSVNTFLASLAEDQGDNAVAIILSGFGSDGALGVAAVKENGGLTFSQAEADHHAKQGMPLSAASSGFVDHILPVEDMSQALLDYRHHRAIWDTDKGPDGIRKDLPSRLATICAVLHSRLGRDFSSYKTGTMMRRIQRRMHVLQTYAVADYIQQLRTLPHEAELLFRELLISVTRFFRDCEAFAALEAQVIPELFADPNSIVPVRVWVAGCATGEEAYSVAILLKEAMLRSGCRRPVQVFATDMDDRAVAFARAGLYLGAIAADLSAERLEKNFVKEDGSYRVTKDLREMCLFSTHDLVKDPPFSRLDLVCCRNLLIYFEPQLQQRVVATFHYALRPGRHLFLGPSESVASQAHLFAPLDKRHRLYARRDTAVTIPALPSPRPPDAVSQAKPAVRPSSDDIERQAARAIARYAPAFLVVNRNRDILRFSGRTAKFLEPTTGAASLNVIALMHADLRSAARAALNEAAATGERVIHAAVRIRAGDGHESVNLIVEPLSGTEEDGLFVVAFQEVGSGPLTAERSGEPDTPHGDMAPALSREVADLRDQLRSVSEGLEAANEELQSSNEEYLSVNEELQSANEELETSKEELQSLNEELQTINSELNNRNDSLVRTNSDLTNLFDSTSIATLFLDRHLRIRRFTPRLLDIFNVREGDEGRPISDIVTNLTRGGLEQDVQQVLRTFVPSEREVVIAEGGTTYLMQVRPYRDVNGAPDGAVITFVDLSERKKHEQARSKLAAIVESSQDAIIAHDLDGVVTSWNNGAWHLFGASAAQAVGQPMPALVRDAAPCDWAAMLAKLRQGEQIPAFECSGASATGSPVQVSVTISPVHGGDGQIAGVSLVARDIRERKAAEQKAALLLRELDHRVKNILAIVSAVVSQTLRTTADPEAFAAEITGRVQAIAKAHSLLTQSGHGEMSLRAVLQTELAPYDSGAGNVVVTGPDIELTPRAGLALAMAVHELASNAAKYGALSTASGRLTVAWDMIAGDGNPTMTLTWREAGGPVVSPPTRRGFGTTLIERTLTHELDAEVNRQFLAEGLLCTITVSMTDDVGHLMSTGQDGGTP